MKEMIQSLKKNSTGTNLSVLVSIGLVKLHALTSELKGRSAPATRITASGFMGNWIKSGTPQNLRYLKL